MDRLKYLLQQEKKKSQDALRKSEKIVHDAPEGKLRVSMDKGKYRYYLVEEKEDARTEQYLKKNDQYIAAKLAEKEYAQKTIECAKKMLSAIKKLEKTYEECQVDQIYDHLHPGRKTLVSPIVETTEIYVTEWLSEKQKLIDTLPKNPYPIKSESYTNNGEIVRSKSEKNIADLLLKLGIPYKYEVPLKLKNGRIIYPDFTILNKQTREEFYLEHLGMMDDPDYVKHHVLEKIPQYEENGIFPGQQLIFTMESLEIPLNTKMLEKQLKKLFLE